ncbi:transcriptional regulator [Kitasatospora sp. NBC_01250]|uniref:transcriptional regulator n=1 Tax=unclassified Kitasatospora TaxID=2633591 RepID=UPI002E1098B8|nr:MULTISPECIES: transcriptional regulator [unclassified Kitasatospora]WSJ65859.1 transcriptional regulator [Kitasatospora sp. NBC_01302]
MTPTPREALLTVRRELTPAERENRLIPRIDEGVAPVAVLAELAAQQHRIIRSDRRSFLVLAARCADTPAGGYFARLAEGESQALDALGAFAAGCGLSEQALGEREPLAGCQAYPGQLAWLALNGEPTAIVLALAANFAAWGGYCAITARALRRHYGFSDAACAFFDFFATPAPELEDEAVAVIEAGGLDEQRLAEGRRYGRLLQAYELMFWNTLADLGPAAAPEDDPGLGLA